MPSAPDDRRSTGTTITIIAAVVVGLFFLGAVILVGIGLLFFTARPEVVIEPAVVNVPRPVEVTRGADPDPIPADTPTDPIAEPIDADVSVQPIEETTEPATSEVMAKPEPIPLETPSPTTVGLVTFTPSESQSIQLGNEPLVRSIDIDGEAVANALWAQPSEDRGVSQLAFNLQQRYGKLQGTAAIGDQPANTDASTDTESPSVTFNIYGDGNLLWTSDVLQGYGTSRTFDVSVEGVARLTLVVESDSSSKASRCAWANTELTMLGPDKSD